MGRSEEWRAAGRLAADAVGGFVGVVSAMHSAIASRVDQFLPASALPVSRMQHLISGAVYRGVAEANRAALTASGEALAHTGGSDSAALSATPFGRVVIPAVNGMWGDRVAARQPALAVQMAVRKGGADLPLTAESVAAAFPEPSPDVVVFLHGLGESDGSWWHRAGPEGSYGDRLRHEQGFSPVYVRCNTGLRISDNGKSLALLLQDLVDAWPVPVRSVSLVGHSLGGLIARSACHYADRHGAEWATKVTAVVALGTPHLGAPLEKGAHVAHRLLALFPETEPLGRMIGIRSVGVKDLRYGHVVEEDWLGHDPDEFLRDRSTEVPFLDHATYYFVAACLTHDPRHPLGLMIGDGVVRYASAAGAGRTKRIPFDIENGAHFGGLGHLSLLNHPRVYEQLAQWLSASREAALVRR